MRVMRLALGFLLAVGFGIGFASLASAVAPSIRIAELKCNGDPEVVTIENTGDAAQQLAGWQLQSDPASEAFDLSVLGALQAGASIFIQAGPSATGVFKWGSVFVFRDDDPTDYARIVDNNGATVDQVNCGGGTPSPSPTPTPPPPNDVPNGGGAPPLPDGPLTPLTLIAAGMALAAAGAAVIAFMRLGASPVAVAAVTTPPLARTAPAAPAVASQRSVRPVRKPSAGSGPAVNAIVGFAALGLLVALAFLLFRGRD